MNGTLPNGKVVAQSSSSWIAVSRDSRNHPIVGCGQPVPPADPKRGSWSRYEAWQDLCMEAAWKPAQATTRGRQVILDRGQILAALPLLATRWNWSVGAVRWFLKTLEEEEMVAKADGGKDAEKDAQQQAKRQATSNASRVLTICNYDRYQMRMELEHLLSNRRNDRQLPTEASEAAIRQSQCTEQRGQNGQQQATQQANSGETDNDNKGISDSESGLTTGSTTATGNTAGKRQATQQATQQAQQQAKSDVICNENKDLDATEISPATGNTAGSTTGNDEAQRQAQQQAYLDKQLNNKKKEEEERAKGRAPNPPSSFSEREDPGAAIRAGWATERAARQAQPRPGVHPYWNTKEAEMEAAKSCEEARMQANVWRDEFGAIIISVAYRDSIRKHYSDDVINDALGRAYGKVTEKSTAVYIAAKISEYCVYAKGEADKKNAIISSIANKPSNKGVPSRLSGHTWNK